ncbi:C40 family peptidase [Ornithinibacillus californiensis]|uniref:C40 family peptidase n=1 Tax=Ornithinibacillus californiensis TaxID=161536 RepID=UPI00064DC28E|nr:C40 family peptidase [Ornithinibacillus californiensis]
MFKQTFQLPDVFHVAAVQVVTVWTNPESAREIDEHAISDPTKIEQWIDQLTYEEKVALCNENRVQTQLLYGEVAIITEVKGDWVKITIPSQPSKKDNNGYPGWVPLNQLKQVTKDEWLRAETAAVTSKQAWLENESGEPIINVSYMTCLPEIKKEADRVEVLTPQGAAYLPTEVVDVFPTVEGGKLGNGANIIEAAEKYVGLDYLWGGMSAFGYDCSGFAYNMHKANGYQISRDASDQAAFGKEVPYDELLPGDLLFFAYEEGKGSIHHVGFYYGDGKMIHSPMTGRGIEITELKDTKYEKELCIARRYWEPGDV